MVSQVQKGHGWLAHTLQRFHLLSWVQKNAPKLETAAKNLSKPALSEGTNLAGAAFSAILSLFTIAFLSLFMLLEAPRLRAGLLGTMRPDRRATIEDIAHRVSHQVTGYVLGTVALSVMFGVVVLVTMLILGVPFAVLIGLWVALVAMIPLIGGLIAAIPSVLLAFLHNPTSGLVMFIVFVGFQLIENHFLYPVIMSRSVRMNPLVGVAVGVDRRQPGRRLRLHARGAGRRGGGHPGRGGDPGHLQRGLEPDPGRRRGVGWCGRRAWPSSTSRLTHPARDRSPKLPA